MVNDIVQETQSKYQSPLCNEKLPFTSTFFFVGVGGGGLELFLPTYYPKLNYIMKLKQLKRLLQ